MILYPAIDLRNGQCVRLYKGDYAQETIYASDPIKMANTFIEEGAQWIHIVDLDAAKDPQKNQAELIVKIANSIQANIQTGGGIRETQQIQYLLENNIDRVIIGSLAVKEPEKVLKWFSQFGPEKMVLALDITFDQNNIPCVATNAWQETSSKTLFEIIDYYHKVGLKEVLCTDISKDGTLTGPNFELYQMMQTQYPELNIQASGGIHALSDLQKLQEQNISGAIIGRALYEHKFTLQHALEITREKSC